MPTILMLYNCPHSADGWCLECVREAQLLQMEEIAALQQRLRHIATSNSDDWRWYQNQAKQACRALKIEAPGLSFDEET